MTHWHERSREEKALLNPVFCSLLFWNAARGYASFNQDNLSFEESFLILPMVLHRTIREELPRDTRTSLALWINTHPLAPRQIVTRARLLVPFTKEGIFFGGVHGLISIDEGKLHANEDWRLRINYSLRDASDEVRFCARRAEFVGKWFAHTGSGSTVLALIGVRP